MWLTVGVLFDILTPMKRRSRTYYTIRSTVRFAFWTSVAMGSILIAGHISTIGQKPECPITLHGDFTYTRQAPFNADECDPGDNVTLTGPHTWEWTE